MNSIPPLYRVTHPGDRWHAVLAGLGTRKLKKAGHRYNSFRSKFTTYLTPTPLAAIAETAYYAAIRIQQNRLPSFFEDAGLAFTMEDSHILWCFHLVFPTNPRVVDLSDAATRVAHGNYPPFLLRNPSRSYRATQQIAESARQAGADLIVVPSTRASIDPVLPLQYNASNPLYPGNNGRAVPCGLRASAAENRVLFHKRRKHRPKGVFLQAWQLDIKFLDHDRLPVSHRSQRIDWDLPQYCLLSLDRRLCPPTRESSDYGIASHNMTLGEWRDIHVRFD